MSRRKSDLSRALPAKVDPLRESSADVWRRWSQDAADRSRAEKIKHTAALEQFTERGIYPIEVARTVAREHATGAAPDWRYLKDAIAQQYGAILKAQPEMRQRDVRAREAIIVALFNALPAHMHGALSELRVLIELVSTARESAAFLLGYEIGREAGHRLALRDPALMKTPDPARRGASKAQGGQS